MAREKEGKRENVVFVFQLKVNLLIYFVRNYHNLLNLLQ